MTFLENQCGLVLIKDQLICQFVSYLYTQVVLTKDKNKEEGPSSPSWNKVIAFYNLNKMKELFFLSAAVPFTMISVLLSSPYCKTFFHFNIILKELPSTGE